MPELESPFLFWLALSLETIISVSPKLLRVQAPISRFGPGKNRTCLFRQVLFSTRTGATRKVFRVKNAAAAVGVDEVDSIIPRSGTPAAF